MAKGPTSPTHRLSSLGTEAVSSIETESIDTGPERASSELSSELILALAAVENKQKLPLPIWVFLELPSIVLERTSFHHFHKHSQPRFEKKKKHVGFNI